MKTEEIKNEIEKALPDIKLKLVRDSICVENPEDLSKVVRVLKESPAFRFDYLSSITGADYLDYLESIYHFYSVEKKKGSLTLRVRLDRQNPKVPSLVPFYRGADFQEREVYDLFGIVYEGHPHLERLFMWEEFKEFPMRKDFVQEDSEVLEVDDIRWLETAGVTVPEKMKEQAEELKKQGKRALAEKEGREKG